MNRLLKFSVSLTVLGVVMGVLPVRAAETADVAQTTNNVPLKNLNTTLPGLPGLTPSDSSGHAVHIFPTQSVSQVRAAALADTGPLVYHGGPVMTGAVSYIIYWAPPTLQNGQPANMPAAYQSLQTRFLRDYPANSMGSINNQYYKMDPVTKVKTYIPNTGYVAGTYVDTSPYPASGCIDTATPENCVTDAQIQAEIQKVMALKGWTGGYNKIFFVFTSQGEGSCFDSSGQYCAYTYYCGYHSYFGNTTTPVIYSNIPYADYPGCQGGATSPNNNPAGDATASIVSHELSEAITDPLLNAWYSASGNENGDLCAWNYGTNTWAYNSTLSKYTANEFWNGHFYELQMEYNNHAAKFNGNANGCTLSGP